jgi:uncharacterized delta-60 repeat protein
MIGTFQGVRRGSVSAITFALAALALLLVTARADAAGELDPSFSGDGRVTTDFGSVNDGAASVATDSLGRIVAAGYSVDNSHSSGVIARYRPNGTLDPSFSGDGKVRVPIAQGLTKAVVDSHDRVLVVGTVPGTAGHPGSDFAVARYRPDGTLDPSFSGDGIATIDIRGADMANEVAVDPQGRIVVGGTRGQYASELAIARFNPNGTVDRSFSGDGKVISDFVFGSWATSIAVDSHGRVIGAGDAWSGDRICFGVVRYQANGAFDSAFGNTATCFHGGGTARDVVVDPSNRVLAAGEGFVPGAVYRVFAVARYRATGGLDPTFGGDGRVTTDVGGTSQGAEIRGLAVDSRGRIVAAGDVEDRTFTLARYTPTGALDQSFGAGGALQTWFGGVHGSAGAVAIYAGDRIVAAGKSAGNFALARYVGYP